MFAPPDPAMPPFPPDAIQLCIGDIVLTESDRPPVVALAPGQFRVVDEATSRLPVAGRAAAGVPVSVRMFVLGAESPPQWITP